MKTAIITGVNLPGAESGPWRFDAEFELETTTSDIEVRLWVTMESELALKGYEIVRVKGMNTAEGIGYRVPRRDGSAYRVVGGATG